MVEEIDLRDSKEPDLDRIFEILGNSVRRKILEYLSKEKHYPLQLSKELGISQQAVMKHLKILEDAGIVEAHTEETPGRGPERKYYTIKYGFKLDVTVTKNMFRVNYVPIDEEEKKVDEKSIMDMIKDINETKDPVERLNRIYIAIEQLDHMIEKEENHILDLLQLRDTLLEDAHSLISYMFKNYDKRILLYYILEKHGARLDEIAEAIDIREKVLRELLKDLDELDFI